jgi:isocitrate lyase
MPSTHSNRFDDIRRDYTAADVDRLSGSLRIEHSLARFGAERLWALLHERPFVRAFGRAHRQPGDAAGKGWT